MTNIMQERRGRSARFPKCSGLLWLACALAAAPAQAATETVLHNFAAPQPQGANPLAGVIRDNAGNFYGTTIGGGTWGAGVVYKVNPSGQVIVLSRISVLTLPCESSDGLHHQYPQEFERNEDAPEEDTQWVRDKTGHFSSPSTPR